MYDGSITLASGLDVIKIKVFTFISWLQMQNQTFLIKKYIYICDSCIITISAGLSFSQDVRPIKVTVRGEVISGNI